MKQRILIALMLTGIGFSACRKNDSVDPITPAASATTTSKTNTSAGTSTTNTATAVNGSSTSALSQNTPANDTTRGYIRVQLAQGTSVNNILIQFRPNSQAAYVNTEDALTFQGFSTLNFSSLSSDSKALVINTLPLSSAGTTVGLSVSAVSSGTYKLNLTKVASIPANFDIWLKDSVAKDSLDFRNNPAYTFNIDNNDTTTYGSHRFSLVLRQHK